jgi:3D (Asp-Asp-Asp) domain-containing protein
VATSSAATSPTLREQADALQARGAALRASANAALLELYAAQSALDRARVDRVRLDTRAAALAAEEASARRRAVLLRRSARAVQMRVHETLRALYVEGDVDPVGVILGATSLDDALDSIDALSRATRSQRRLAAELRLASGRLERFRHVLAGRRRALHESRRRASEAAARLEQAGAARRATLAEVQRRADLTTHQVATLEARASAASAAAARIAAPPPVQSQPEQAPAGLVATGPATAAVSSVRPPPGGTRKLVVHAVAYHLPGRTASGLPVGIGVIAVDPRVIPLGTRVYVPGYGPAVAADVGSAVVGNLIDLWMPSTSEALAWGRRTVTITVYG